MSTVTPCCIVFNSRNRNVSVTEMDDTCLHFPGSATGSFLTRWRFDPFRGTRIADVDQFILFVLHNPCASLAVDLPELFSNRELVRAGWFPTLVVEVVGCPIISIEPGKVYEVQLFSDRPLLVRMILAHGDFQLRVDGNVFCDTNVDTMLDLPSRCSMYRRNSSIYFNGLSM